MGLPDNSGHSQTNRAFHNNSRQTEMSPLLASRQCRKGTSLPLIQEKKCMFYSLRKLYIQLSFCTPTFPMISKCENAEYQQRLIRVDGARGRGDTGRHSCPRYSSRENERKVWVNCESVLWDGWGFGLFRAAFDEPVGPPSVLAKVLSYNQLQVTLTSSKCFLV